MHWRFIGPAHGVLRVRKVRLSPTAQKVNLELHVFWGDNGPTMALWIWSERGRVETGVAGFAMVGAA